MRRDFSPVAAFSAVKRFPNAVVYYINASFAFCLMALMLLLSRSVAPVVPPEEVCGHRSRISQEDVTPVETRRDALRLPGRPRQRRDF